GCAALPAPPALRPRLPPSPARDLRFQRPRPASRGARGVHPGGRPPEGLLAQRRVGRRRDLRPRTRRSRAVSFLRRAPGTAAVAIAFADSSIVVLALPELYGRFDTTIQGVSWVVTAYNAAVAVTAIALVLFVHRLNAGAVLGTGLGIFLAASIACAAAQSLGFLVGARAVQGTGAALLLAGSLPMLGPRRWTAAGTFGLALGPALGGVLTQAFDWRAIFIVQAPIAGLALVAVIRAHAHVEAEEGWKPSLARTLPANACLGLLFGALVGALFLAVLLVISVWGYSPIGGA